MAEAVFSLVLSEVKILGWIFQRSFFQRKSLSWILAIFIPVVYYGISITTNVRFTGDSLLAYIYLFLYGGLEEWPIWRWFYKIFSKHFITKMIVSFHLFGSSVCNLSTSLDFVIISPDDAGNSFLLGGETKEYSKDCSVTYSCPYANW